MYRSAYRKKIRGHDNVESTAVLKYDAVHGSVVDESDCGVILGAGEGQYFWWRNFLIAVSLSVQQRIALQ